MLRNFRKMLKNQKGFTLVEVIVVAVIVAVLAAVAIPLYLGYIESSKVNIANNTAGSAASCLAAARNSSAPDANFPSPLLPNTSWTYTPAGATTAVTFTAPDKATITKVGTMATGGTVTCTYDGQISTGTYSW
jgi:prepilin-type N-terminal cleavage/methylation domain-containing protein